MQSSVDEKPENCVDREELQGYTVCRDAVKPFNLAAKKFSVFLDWDILAAF